MWPGGAMIKASDLQSTGYEFDCRALPGNNSMHTCASVAKLGN